MRHKIETIKLGADADHKRSLLRNLSNSLIDNGKIVTTLSKAKKLRPYIEKLITKSIKMQGHNRVRYLQDKLIKKVTTKKLINEISAGYAQYKGGYTRIVKIPNRKGDNAPMARIELVTESKSKND